MNKTSKLFATYESKKNEIVIKKETSRKQIVNGKAHMIPCQVSIASIPTFERYAPASWWKNLPELEGERVFVEKYLKRQEMYDHLFSVKEDSELSVKIRKINYYKSILADSANVVRYYKVYGKTPKITFYSYDVPELATIPWLDFSHTLEGIKQVFRQLTENETFDWLFGDKLANLCEFHSVQTNNQKVHLNLYPIDRLARAIIRINKKYPSRYEFCRIIEESGYKDSEYDEVIQIIARKLTDLIRKGQAIAYEDDKGQTKLIFRKYYLSAGRGEVEKSHYMDLVHAVSNYSKKKAKESVRSHYVAGIVDKEGQSIDKMYDNCDYCSYFTDETESLTYAKHYVEQFGKSDAFKAEYEDIIKYVHKHRPRILNAFKVWLYCQTHDVMQKTMSELSGISETRISKAGKIWHDDLESGYHARFKKLF